MPNHITTIITASPEVVQTLIRRRTEEELAKARRPIDPEELIVDFALLIPTPEDYISENCSHDHGFLSNTADPYPNCWYSWNRANWGTKWNGYDTSVRAVEGDRAELRFDTAWSHPVPVIEALAQKFPDEKIEVAYADEDLGSNVGRYTMIGNEVIDEYFPEYGEESLELAARIKYGLSYAELQAEWDGERD